MKVEGEVKKMVDENNILNVAQALSSETRLNLIKTIGKKSLSLYEIKNQYFRPAEKTSHETSLPPGRIFCFFWK